MNNPEYRTTVSDVLEYQGGYFSEDTDCWSSSKSNGLVYSRRIPKKKIK